MPATPLPTVAPALATLVPAAVPPAPQGLTLTQSTEWTNNHEFVHLLEAIYQHIKRLPNRQSDHVRELSLLYWNQHIAGLVLSGQNYHRWENRGSLFSQKSRLKLAIVNLILASKGLPEAKTVKGALDTWNMYLQSLNLPGVTRVGDGLHGVANPGPIVGSAAAAAAGATGGSRALEELRRRTAEEQDAVAALVELRGSTAGPSRAAPVGPDNDDDDEDSEEEKDDDGDDEQLPTKRRRVIDDREDGREEAETEERGKSNGKGKERATDW